MTTLTYPDVLPGTIGLTYISGAGGKIIGFGQWLAENPVKKWFSKDTLPPIDHSFTYLGATEQYPEGAILEAEPGGARIRSVSEHSSIYWCTDIATKYKEFLPKVAENAPHFQGTPYSFLDYLSIALHRMHIRLPLLKSYIAATHHQICSQLCDWLYDISGAHLFTDRWEGDVMPMDLYFLDQALGKQAAK